MCEGDLRRVTEVGHEAPGEREDAPVLGEGASHRVPDDRRGLTLEPARLLRNARAPWLEQEVRRHRERERRRHRRSGEERAPPLRGPQAGLRAEPGGSGQKERDEQVQERDGRRDLLGEHRGRECCARRSDPPPRTGGEREEERGEPERRREEIRAPHERRDRLDVRRVDREEQPRAERARGGTRRRDRREDSPRQQHDERRRRGVEQNVDGVERDRSGTVKRVLDGARERGDRTVGAGQRGAPRVPVVLREDARDVEGPDQRVVEDCPPVVENGLVRKGAEEDGRGERRRDLRGVASRHACGGGEPLAEGRASRDGGRVVVRTDGTPRRHPVIMHRVWTPTHGSFPPLMTRRGRPPPASSCFGRTDPDCGTVQAASAALSRRPKLAKEGLMRLKLLRMAMLAILQAFSWSSGTASAQEIPRTILGPGTSFGVNAYGQVAGWSDWQAVLWNGDGSVQRLPGLGGESAALALNDVGVAVGVCGLTAGYSYPFHACAWMAGGELRRSPQRHGRGGRVPLSASIRAGILLVIRPRPDRSPERRRLSRVRRQQRRHGGR